MRYPWAQRKPIRPGLAQATSMGLDQSQQITLADVGFPWQNVNESKGLDEIIIIIIILSLTISSW